MADLLNAIMATIGWLFVAARILGALDVADFHVYFGPAGGAATWHQKHAGEQSTLIEKADYHVGQFDIQSGNEKWVATVTKEPS